MYSEIRKREKNKFATFDMCNQVMRKTVKYIGKTLLYMFLILMGMLVMFYLMAPVYDFSGPVAFHGSKLYNPYQNMNPENWHRYNFQVQSEAWGGITSGRGNSNEMIDSVYQMLGFDHVSTSDYQKINHFGSDRPSYIPTYEHGYSLFKVHQVCIGASRILWIDLILFQTISMKQWIIDLLNKDCEIVALAHPNLRGGYPPDDLKKLTHYQLMEALNRATISVKHWDTALSSGQLVWLLGDDDAHDVLNSDEVGRTFTVINSPTLNREDIIHSLKTGNAYGADLFPKTGLTFSERVERLRHVPVVKKVELSGDTLKVAIVPKPMTINFIGQNGKLRNAVQNSATASYVIKRKDNYIRVEFVYPDGSVIYLNPIIRYEGDRPVSLLKAEVNETATINLRIVYFLIFLTFMYLFARKNRKLKRN